MAAAVSSGALRERGNSFDLLIEFRLVLVGKTGAGKSSSGNTILGRDAFKAAVSQASVTRGCMKQTGEVFGRSLTIVDTPGLFDTSLPERTVRREIYKCINMSAPGPHAILLVIKVGTFTEEEKEAVKLVEEIFGVDAWRYTMVLFTQDQEPVDLQRQLEEAGPELHEVLQKAGNRYHVLNNSSTSNRGQVLALLEKVEQMVSANGGGCYTNSNYKQVELMLNEKEAKLREHYQRELQEKVQAVETKYQKMLMESEQEHRRVKQRLQLELKELKRYYQALEGGARLLLEETSPDDSLKDVIKYAHTLRLKLN